VCVPKVNVNYLKYRYLTNHKILKVKHTSSDILAVILPLQLFSYYHHHHHHHLSNSHHCDHCSRYDEWKDRIIQVRLHTIIPEIQSIRHPKGMFSCTALVTRKRCPCTRYIRSGGTAPRILNSGSNWTWVVSFRLRPLYPGERATGTYSLGEWLGQRTGLDAFENRRISCLARNSITTPQSPGRNSVTIPTRTYLEFKSFQRQIF